MSLVGQCLASWAFVEFQLAMLLGVRMKAESGQTMAVFMILRRFTNQKAAIVAAADDVLSEPDKELMTAVVAVQQSIEGERNDLAHGLFGVAHELSDALVWIDMKHHAPWSVEQIRIRRDRDTSDLAKHVFLYRQKDLEGLLQSIGEIGQVSLSFVNYVRNRLTTPDDPSLDERYRQLCSEPRIAQALSDLRNRKNKLEAQP
jgi:hypothetical protein